MQNISHHLPRGIQDPENRVLGGIKGMQYITLVYHCISTDSWAINQEYLAEMFQKEEGNDYISRWSLLGLTSILTSI